MDDDDDNGETDEGPVTKLEISKAAGIDNTTEEMIKDDIDTTVDALHDIFQINLGRENTENCSKDLKLPKKGDLNNCGNW